MSTPQRRGAAYAPGAGVARGNVAEHSYGFTCQPGHLVPRERPRVTPVQVPELNRAHNPVHLNPFPSDVSVSIHDGPGARVTDVHIAGPDGVLRLAGEAAGPHVVPRYGAIMVAWLGPDVPTWEWAPIPGDPGEE